MKRSGIIRLSENAARRLPLLHLWQEHFGFISDEGVRWIAAKLELQPINILELVTFYPMFRAKAGRQETHSRLPDVELRDGRQLSVMEKLCAAAGIDRHHDDRTACTIRSPSARTETTASSLSNVSPAAGPRRFAWWMMSCARTCQPGRQRAFLSDRKPQIANRNSPPHPLERRLIFKNIGRADWTTDIDCYLRDGGYEQLKKAVTMSRTDIVNEVKTSGLRGRGGAGFPAA